jgi:hypothetical protein
MSSADFFEGSHTESKGKRRDGLFYYTTYGYALHPYFEYKKASKSLCVFVMYLSCLPTYCGRRVGNMIHNQSILDAAQHYAAQGFVVIPCKGKRPTVDDWPNASVPDEATIATWKGLNIGIVTGERSNNLIVIDFDGWEGYRAFKHDFPQYADTFTVATGSGNGAHVYLQVDILPQTTKAMKIAQLDNVNIELKANGQQVIAAPSIHPNTKKPYRTYLDKPILRVEHVQDIVNWIEDFKPERERRKQQTYQLYEGNEPPADVTEAIFAALGVTGSRINKSGHTAHAILCPFHDDTEPTAGVKMVTDARSKAGGISCPSCGKFYNWKDVAARLNIPIPELKPFTTEPTVSFKDVVAAPDNGLWFAEGVPDSWRSILLKYFDKTTAPLIEGMLEVLRQGLLKQDGFDLNMVIEQLKAIGFHLAPGTVRRIFPALIGVFFSKVDPISYIPSSSFAPTFENKSKGRPPDFFRLLSRDTVIANMLSWCHKRIVERYLPGEDADALVVKFEAEMLEAVGVDPDEAEGMATRLNDKTTDYRLQPQREAKYESRHKQVLAEYTPLKKALLNFYSTTLPATEIHSAKDYRAVLARRQIEAGDNNRKVRDMAQAFGVSRSYVANVLKHGGMKNAPQSKKVAFDKTNVRRYNTIIYGEISGFPRAVIIEKQRITGTPDAIKAWVREAVERGQKVEVECQVAGLQHVIRLDILPLQPPKASRQYQPRLKQAAQTPKPRRTTYYLGAGYDPEWVARHIVQAFKVTHRGYAIHRNMLLDKQTGEILQHGFQLADLIKSLQTEGLITSDSSVPKPE